MSSSIGIVVILALALALVSLSGIGIALVSLSGVGVGIRRRPFVGRSSPPPSTPRAVAHSRGVGGVVQAGTHYHPASRGLQRWWVGAKQMAMGAVSLLKHS